MLVFDWPKFLCSDKFVSRLCVAFNSFIAKEACVVVRPIFFSTTSNCVVGIDFHSAMQDGNQSLVTSDIVFRNFKDPISVRYFTPQGKTA